MLLHVWALCAGHALRSCSPAPFVCNKGCHCLLCADHTWTGAVHHMGIQQLTSAAEECQFQLPGIIRASNQRHPAESKGHEFSQCWLLPASTAAAAACAVAHVSTWDQLFHATISQQQIANRVHIILDANITVAMDFSRETNGTMLIYRDVQVRMHSCTHAWQDHAAGCIVQANMARNTKCAHAC